MLILMKCVTRPRYKGEKAHESSPTGLTETAKIEMNECSSVSQDFRQNQHTNIGVHLGCIHGLNELAKAFLVTVHLPVSTDKEFPGHFCGIRGCLRGMKTVLPAHKMHKGERADARVQQDVFMKWGDSLAPPPQRHWRMVARP